MKISPTGDVLFHTNGRTVMTVLVVYFRNFVKAPKHAETRRSTK